MRRWLRPLLSRIRDLGLFFLVAEHFWAGLAGWLTLCAGLAFAAFAATVTASAATTHAKAVNTENRLNALIPVLGGITGQQGKGSSLSFPNLSQTETGSPQVGGATIQTGSPNVIGSGSVTNHSHGYGHLHFTQVAGDYNNLMTTLNQLKADLQAAGIL